MGKQALLAPVWGCDPIRSPQVGQTSFLISTAASGKQANNPSQYFAWISDDGRKVAFSSYANNLVFDQPGSTDNVYVKSREDGSIVLADRNSDAGDAPPAFNIQARDIFLSGNGRFVVFTALGYLDNGAGGGGVNSV